MRLPGGHVSRKRPSGTDKAWIIAATTSRLVVKGGLDDSNLVVKMSFTFLFHHRHK